MSDTPEQLLTWSARCTRLSRAVADGDRNEFLMRVPAEPDRDADLVLASVAVALKRYAELLEQCAPYLKDGESPARRIERDHLDSLMLMKQLAAEKHRVGELKKRMER